MQMWLWRCIQTSGLRIQSCYSCVGLVPVVTSETLLRPQYVCVTVHTCTYLPTSMSSELGQHHMSTDDPAGWVLASMLPMMASSPASISCRVDCVGRWDEGCYSARREAVHLYRTGQWQHSSVVFVLHSLQIKLWIADTGPYTDTCIILTAALHQYMQGPSPW